MSKLPFVLLATMGLRGGEQGRQGRGGRKQKELLRREAQLGRGGRFWGRRLWRAGDMEKERVNEETI